MFHFLPEESLESGIARGMSPCLAPGDMMVSPAHENMKRPEISNTCKFPFSITMNQ